MKVLKWAALVLGGLVALGVVLYLAGLFIPVGHVAESTEPVRLVMRIADDKLPFGGIWTYEIQEEAGGTRITITEDGEIYSPFFRVMSRFFFGYHATQESYLTALSTRFGETPTIERIQ